MKPQDALKKAVGEKAANLIEDGMLVGLGTGSTAAFFIKHLIERVKGGLSIKAVSSSIASAKQAREGGIEVLEMDEVTSIDLTIDGADEIDPQNRMIKGGGGAHVREKIIASTSKQMVVIVDESKMVDVLGSFGLPVEILPYGYHATIAKIEKLGYRGKLRMKESALHLTDNGNYLYDIHEPKQFPHPENDHTIINNLPGVVDTGFFFNLPVKVLVGYQNGTVDFR
ncbi:MAG: Ribose-5-phosphate isomerase A [Chlamydiales bacterium]|nr:Ribose-5-phosphate isomerase A [Chlamydiales bacterium]MCH9620353.1 Ribose-5-phosphate isomerase A [Chlamydiales bacterium]MCH9622339.1 Ribose-5-phosphate isomerase A [Chlamydiales bacterium]